MLYEEERKQAIADYVGRQGRASVQELASRFQVSESTVRRDLRELEAQKQLRRTHGGAIAPLPGSDAEPTFLEKEDRFQQQKADIARRALAMIGEGDTVFLDAGTTTYQLAKLLKGFARLTVVTNSLKVVQELAEEKQIDLLTTGGTLRPETMAMVGPFAERSIESVRVDKLFLATNGFDAQSGLTTPNLIEAATKRRMIGSAHRVILLADHSKYGNVTFARFGELSDISTLITDSRISRAAVEEIEKVGVEVILADSGGDTA
ncbi:DeoR/GlpR family DNA-binding transcription regulator [Paenibacillus thailandensis]|uniref:DeoR/GlpR family DNA-binding transcription regulator n=1 Tax=Paenibacillus thailandensis TaxID=393250 RepID=A0ABW5QWM8_9BACL